MSSNAFVDGTRMSGVCAFIAGNFEYEHKTLLIHRPTTVTFASTYAASCACQLKQLTQCIL